MRTLWAWILATVCGVLFVWCAGCAKVDYGSFHEMTLFKDINIHNGTATFDPNTGKLTGITINDGTSTTADVVKQAGQNVVTGIALGMQAVSK